MIAKENARISSLVITATMVLLTCSVRLDSQKAPAPAPKDPPQVRMRWQDFISGPAGAKRLASLQAAVAKMKSLDNSPPASADFRRSWQYWANIHGYYGASSPDGTVAAQIQYLKDNNLGNYVSYYQGIVDQTPPDSIATAIWATCQHSNPPQQANFFGWHRMYLYYFERVLRWAANDNTLRLPYWDYTDPTQEALPKEFQTAASIFYDAKRDPGMNTGADTLNSGSTNVNALLRDTNYLRYEGKIEEGIHGYVHCTVGPTCPVAHMGDVPVAGNDPIFYTHHANIDRLWACWQNLHTTQAGAWQTQQFSFVDETGTLQTQPVKNFLQSASLGYVYDNFNSCSRTSANVLAVKAQVAPAPAAGGAKMTLLGSNKSVAINSAQTTVDITLPAPRLQNLFAQAQGGATTELVLRDITAQSHPGVMSNVYLAKKDDPKTRVLVGTISWFGAFRHHGGKVPEKKTLTFDVTDQLRELGGASGLTVVIEASQGRVPVDPSKADAERAKAATAFRAQAKMTIGSIDLQQVAAPAPPAATKKP